MNHKSALHNKIFEVIAKASQELQVESYVIGGFVRDFLLGRDFKKGNEQGCGYFGECEQGYYLCINWHRFRCCRWFESKELCS